MRKSVLVMLGLIVLSFIIGAIVYPLMPEQVASHWNASGEVDGYMPKFWGVFLLPIISIPLLFLFILIPRIDPLKENIERFRRYYDLLVVLIMFFLFYIYVLTIAWSLGFRYSMNMALSPAMGVLYYFMGVVLGKARRNWFVGIRTPWTLSSELVWDKTHRRGEGLFKLCGLIAVFGILFEDYAVFFMVGPVLLASAYLVLYSYLEYTTEMRELKKKKSK